MYDFDKIFLLADQTIILYFIFKKNIHFKKEITELILL